mmetsp:Transcript_20386/g.65190  ORF Transcript_20386/g.65190 Transcript_20386/m.65190 type:complete len:225 (+) Transcript_20386:877-1551(+)
MLPGVAPESPTPSPRAIATPVRLASPSPGRSTFSTRTGSAWNALRTRIRLLVRISSSSHARPTARQAASTLDLCSTDHAAGQSSPPAPASCVPLAPSATVARPFAPRKASGARPRHLIALHSSPPSCFCLTATAAGERSATRMTHVEGAAQDWPAVPARPVTRRRSARPLASRTRNVGSGGRTICSGRSTSLPCPSSRGRSTCYPRVPIYSEWAAFLLVPLQTR